MTDAPIARTASGVVRGSLTDGVRRFLGMPYAAPPFGALRFQPPAPPAAWEGERDATEFGPTPPQAPYAGAIGELLGSVEIPGDDTLTVNVFAPEGAASLPVVLWIHGGALERGTAALSLYDGTRFAQSGVVFVSCNYRLGSEGFSVLDDAEPNLGVQDCAAALAWVHREIAAFGGDPERITVMGESAGGAMVACLAAMPASSAMMAGAIIESGPLRTQPRKKAGRVTQALAKRANVPPTVGGLGALAPTDLVALRSAQAAGSSPLGGAPGFQVAETADLPVSPHIALKAADFPVLIGTNTDEYRLWFTDSQLAEISALKLWLARTVLGISSAAVRAYRAAWPGASTGEIFGQLATDIMLRRDAVRLADDRATQTYVYEFAWQSPVRRLRAAHAMELAFVFDALQNPEARRMGGTDAPQHLADEMHGAWVRFIKTGDPGWAAYGADRNVRRFDYVSETLPLPRAEAVDLLPR